MKERIIKMVLEYAFMFPIAIIIAIMAMSLGIGGAIFFSPIFLILFPALGVSQLTPADALGAALVTELFGFASGFLGYHRQKLIDFKTGASLLVFSIPLGIIGAILKRNLEGRTILLIFTIGIWILTFYTFNENYRKSETNFSEVNGVMRQLVDANGEKYEYKLCNQWQGRSLIAVGGLFTGIMSVGIGETTMPTLRMRCNIPMKIASATSVFVVIFTVLAASMTDIVIVGLESVPWTLVLFTIPGVIIGGQIGPRFASRISSQSAEKLLIGVFLMISVLMTYVVLSN